MNLKEEIEKMLKELKEEEELLTEEEKEQLKVLLNLYEKK